MSNEVKIALPDGMTAEHCQYLEDLRQSGETNMFGAVPYLESEFDIDREQGVTILSFWMKNYQSLIDDGFFTRG